MQNTNYTSFTNFIKSNPFEADYEKYDFNNINFSQIPIFTLELKFKNKTQLKNYLLEIKYLEPNGNSKFFDFISAPYNHRPIIKPEFFKLLKVYLNNNSYTIRDYREFKENYLSYCELLDFNPNSSEFYTIK